MNYLSKFDKEGKRESSIPVEDSMDAEQIEKLKKEGYIEHSEEDWHYYIGNRGDGDNGTGYIRDTKTGKPVSAPAIAIKPVVEEKAESIPETTLAVMEGMAEMAAESETLKVKIEGGR